jgi:Fe-S cluster assembly ATP-binding protein
VEDKEILKGLDLTVKQGEIHALMGPNGAGKSTLANTLMGHPGYEPTQGRILFKGTDIMELAPDERSRMGLFLAFQYPVAIPGVSVANFLRMAINARREKDDSITVRDFRELLKGKMDLLKISHEFAGRYLNDGFSGGEKKRAEILQLATLEPQIAILDETDSGLDIDAVRIVASGVNSLVGEDLGILIITHYQRILNYIKPDQVHVLMEGRIIESGGPELAGHLEQVGYEGIQER